MVCHSYWTRLCKAVQGCVWLWPLWPFYLNWAVQGCDLDGLYLNWAMQGCAWLWPWWPYMYTGLCYGIAFCVSSIQLRWVSEYSWAVFSVFWGDEVWGDDVMTLRWGYDAMVWCNNPEVRLWCHNLEVRLWCQFSGWCPMVITRGGGSWEKMGLFVPIIYINNPQAWQHVLTSTPDWFVDIIDIFAVSPDDTLFITIDSW